MKHVHLTWYLLVDGTQADPNDVAPDADGVLRHENGLAVALHEDGTPCSIGVGASENMNVQAAEAGDNADTSGEEHEELVHEVDRPDDDVKQEESDPTTPEAKEESASVETTPSAEKTPAPSGDKPAAKKPAVKAVTAAKPQRRYQNREMKA